MRTAVSYSALVNQLNSNPLFLFFVFLDVYVPLLQDKESVARVVQVVDKANGYSYATVDANKLEFSRLTAAPPPFDDQR